MADDAEKARKQPKSYRMKNNAEKNKEKNAKLQNDR